MHGLVLNAYLESCCYSTHLYSSYPLPGFERWMHRRKASWRYGKCETPSFTPQDLILPGLFSPQRQLLGTSFSYWYSIRTRRASLHTELIKSPNTILGLSQQDPTTLTQTINISQGNPPIPSHLSLSVYLIKALAAETVCPALICAIASSRLLCWRLLKLGWKL